MCGRAWASQLLALALAHGLLPPTHHLFYFFVFRQESAFRFTVALLRYCENWRNFSAFLPTICDGGAPLPAKQHSSVIMSKGGCKKLFEKFFLHAGKIFSKTFLILGLRPTFDTMPEKCRMVSVRGARTPHPLLGEWTCILMGEILTVLSISGRKE